MGFFSVWSGSGLELLFSLCVDFPDFHVDDIFSSICNLFMIKKTTYETISLKSQCYDLT